MEVNNGNGCCDLMPTTNMHKSNVPASQGLIQLLGCERIVFLTWAFALLVSPSCGDGRHKSGFAASAGGCSPWPVIPLDFCNTTNHVKMHATSSFLSFSLGHNSVRIMVSAGGKHRSPRLQCAQSRRQPSLYPMHGGQLTISTERSCHARVTCEHCRFARAQQWVYRETTFHGWPFCHWSNFHGKQRP